MRPRVSRDGDAVEQLAVSTVVNLSGEEFKDALRRFRRRSKEPGREHGGGRGGGLARR
jgi:hypothetical protein